MKWMIAATLALVVPACGEDQPIGDDCAVQALPFTGADPDAVTILSARLECTADYITPLVTARHATPSELDMVQQTIGIYPDSSCAGSPIEVTDDVFSDLEESFGETIDRATSPDLFDRICNSSEWPLRVSFGTQSSFPTTSGTIAATITQ